METKCFVCGTDEKGKVYIRCIHEGEDRLVCVRCLPMLIHGVEV
jgi:hypothetical protein